VAPIIFLSSDLMFSSRVLASAKTMGTPLQLVSDQATLSQVVKPDCTLVIVDLSLGGLDLPAVIAEVRGAAQLAQILAYGAHVDEEALAAARQAGCDQVLSRGQFHKHYAELLRSAST
jgi:DNA-binding NarL/FixJ family response regulator